MVGTGAAVFLIFGVGDEALAALAIPTFVVGFIDVGLKFGPDFLDECFVALIRSANKVGVFDAEFFNEILELFRVFVDIFFNVNV